MILKCWTHFQTMIKWPKAWLGKVGAVRALWREHKIQTNPLPGILPGRLDSVTSYRSHLKPVFQCLTRTFSRPGSAVIHWASTRTCISVETQVIGPFITPHQLKRNWCVLKSLFLDCRVNVKLWRLFCETGCVAKTSRLWKPIKLTKGSSTCGLAMAGSIVAGVTMSLFGG